MTRFYIEGAEEFDRACRLLDKRECLDRQSRPRHLLHPDPYAA